MKTKQHTELVADLMRTTPIALDTNIGCVKDRISHEQIIHDWHEACGGVRLNTQSHADSEQ